MSSYRVIELCGSALERGTAYGRAAQDLIHTNLDAYREHFAASGLAWQEACSRAQRFLPSIDAFDQELSRELRAIATAADVELVDLLVLNGRTSLAYNMSDDCTSIAFVATRQNRATALGQNWDNMARLRPVLLRVIRENTPTILTLTEAGTLAKIGLNSAGIGVCVNGLPMRGKPAEGCVPLFVFLRKFLEMRSLAEALDLLGGTRRDAPHNFLVASRNAGAVSVEALFDEIDVLTTSRPFLVHTNHLLSPKLRSQVTPRGCENSVLRLRRAEEVLEEQGQGPLTMSAMVAALTDHKNGVDAICRHATSAGEGLQILTKHAVMMDLVELRVSVSDGPPCLGSVASYLV